MTGPRNRRTLLQLGGSAAVAALAGCSTIRAELGLRTVQLGEVRLETETDEPTTVEVTVIRDDDPVHTSTHDLEPAADADDDPQVVLEEWADDPDARSWTVRDRRDDGDWRRAELDAAVGDDEACHGVRVTAGDWPETDLLVALEACDGER